MFILILSLLIFCGSNIIEADPGLKLNLTQANETVKLIVATLLMPENHSGTYGKELAEFTTHATKGVLDKTGNYPNFWSFNKLYTYAELYNGILSEIVRFVEQKSIDYAQEDIINFHLPPAVISKELIPKVGQTIRNDVLKIIMQSETLKEGSLTHFVGALLRVRVHKIIINELKQYSLSENFENNSNSTEICPGCYGYFNAISKQLILPCGHNICTSCIKQKFKESLKPSCAVCKEHILNAEKLMATIITRQKNVKECQRCFLLLDKKKVNEINLSCGHKVCLLCINNFRLNNGKYNCPICQSGFISNKISKPLFESLNKENN